MKSHLQVVRQAFKPILPKVLSSPALKLGEALGAAGDKEQIEKLFPNTYGIPSVQFVEGETLASKALRVGIILSGGQAPGGHNVIAGIYDYVTRMGGVLIGFKGGPRGLFTGDYVEISKEMMDSYRNMGGFDMIGSGRDKIESEEQFAESQRFAEELKLDGIIVIGGDDSNTNAAVLAEKFAANGCACKVCGCPKTIDGDLKNEFIPISFGFDTACKTFAELVGNVETDCLSAKKYYHFVRLMGRSSSHITLEVALQTQPNAVLLSEVVEAKKQSLESVVSEIVKIIVDRAAAGKNYGVVLVPEGLIEFIPELGVLIHELNDVMSHEGVEATVEGILPHLTAPSAKVLKFLPPTIAAQLLADRDPHGNVQVSRIETEKLLVEIAQTQLAELAKDGKYSGKFNPLYHFFGYEGRCGMPSNFDANYCYALGYGAGALIHNNQNGMMSSVSDLEKPVSEWSCGGVPITMMMNMEKRHGVMKPVIKKAFMDLSGLPYVTVAKNKESWAMEDLYSSPGPIQFYGPAADDITKTLALEIETKKSGFKDSSFI
eukprot:TRINITY_DN36492_c0_g1_i1.p1 TRINITY_DN36492_c0_g1~~TRINITY_DN36492_c0_g1_i1.p1  ORF type:complete len:546 (+),score=170.07 TRINITY_DN36492_c0_g1_i1:62-1699(+)